MTRQVVLRFAKSFWNLSSENLGYASKTTPGQFYLFVNVESVVDAPTLITLMSGSVAAGYESHSDRQIVDDVVGVLRCIFGRRVVDHPVDYRVTRWLQDPHARGSYTYIKVGGDPHDVTRLGAPLSGGRLRFAGEATSKNYVASCHGAYLSGIREARSLLDRLVLFEAGVMASASFGDLIDLRCLRMSPLSPSAVCVLCGIDAQEHKELLGALIGPLKGTSSYVHTNCASYSPEIIIVGDRLANLPSMMARARRIQCHGCRRLGATIGCHDARCTRSYHVLCAWQTRWDFHRSDEGEYFYCADHRDRELRCGLHPASVLRSCVCQRWRQRCQECGACIALHCQCECRIVSRAFVEIPERPDVHAVARMTRNRARQRMPSL